MHRVCTMHEVFTERAQGVHGALGLHALCMGPAQGVHGSTQSVDRASMGLAQVVHGARTVMHGHELLIS